MLNLSKYLFLKKDQDYLKRHFIKYFFLRGTKNGKIGLNLAVRHIC